MRRRTELHLATGAVLHLVKREDLEKRTALLREVGALLLEVGELDIESLERVIRAIRAEL